jgi:hypothetical protein
MNTFTCIQKYDHAVGISLHYIASLHGLLLFFYSCILSWERLICCVQNVPGYYDKVYILAPTIWDLWDRFYNLLPVALRVKKTIISPLDRSLKVTFFVKGKQFLCMLLLPIFVSPDTCAYAHFRRCRLTFKRTQTF